MSSLATQLLLHTLQITFSAYALLVITHFLLQTSFAHRSHRRFLHGTGMTTSDGYLPSVDVVVAAYDEDPESLAACFESLVEERSRAGASSCRTGTAASATHRTRPFATAAARSWSRSTRTRSSLPTACANSSPPSPTLASAP